MILIHRITKFCLDNYKKDLIECIYHNLQNSLITNIVIYSTEPNTLGIKNSKIKYYQKIGLTDFDIVKEIKRISNSPAYLFSNPFVKFNHTLSNLELNDSTPISIDNNCYVFFKSTKIIQGTFINEIFESIVITNRVLITVKNLWLDDIKYDSKKPQKVTSNNTDNMVILRKKGEPMKPRLSKIDIVIVSVDYNDFLILTLENNLHHIQNITVVTSSKDKECQNLCKKFGVNCVVTDRMYEKGASFNKGKAINDGIKSIINPDWILLLDADICLPHNFRDIIENLKSNTNNLILADRKMCYDYTDYLKWKNGQEINGEIERGKGWGYFQLFNIAKFNNREPFPENSDDAAQSDISFKNMFVNNKETISGIEVLHLGDPYKNWKGRKTKKFISDSDYKDLISKIIRIEKEESYQKILYLKKENIIKDNIEIKKSESPYIIHVSSLYLSNDKETRRRNDFAQSTWKFLYENNKILPALLYSEIGDRSLPTIKDLFNHGYNFTDFDDDIIMYTNSDICITPDAYQVIVDNCKKFDCTFSFRKDLFYKITKPLSKNEVIKALYSGGVDHPHGADLFAVTRKWWEKWNHLLPDEQVIGRPTWDWLLRVIMGTTINGNIEISTSFERQGIICESPNIIYHEWHESFWEQKENLLDNKSLRNVQLTYKWLSERSSSNFFTGKEWLEKTYGKEIFEESISI